MSESTPQSPASQADGWQTQERQGILTRRFEFASYPETRAFLDRMTGLSEKTGRFPDLNFSKTHVNVSIASDSGQLTDADFQLAAGVNRLAAGPAE